MNNEESSKVHSSRLISGLRKVLDKYLLDFNLKSGVMVKREQLRSPKVAVLEIPLESITNKFSNDAFLDTNSCVFGKDTYLNSIKKSFKNCTFLFILEKEKDLDLAYGKIYQIGEYTFKSGKTKMAQVCLTDKKPKIKPITQKELEDLKKFARIPQVINPHNLNNAKQASFLLAYNPDVYPKAILGNIAKIDYANKSIAINYMGDTLSPGERTVLTYPIDSCSLLRTPEVELKNHTSISTTDTSGKKTVKTITIKTQNSKEENIMAKSPKTKANKTSMARSVEFFSQRIEDKKWEPELLVLIDYDKKEEGYELALTGTYDGEPAIMPVSKLRKQIKKVIDLEKVKARLKKAIPVNLVFSQADIEEDQEAFFYFFQDLAYPNVAGEITPRKVTATYPEADDDEVDMASYPNKNTLDKIFSKDYDVEDYYAFPLIPAKEEEEDEEEEIVVKPKKDKPKSSSKKVKELEEELEDEEEGDDDEIDFTELTTAELRTTVVNAELATKKEAKAMNRDELLELLGVEEDDDDLDDDDLDDDEIVENAKKAVAKRSKKK